MQSRAGRLGESAFWHSDHPAVVHCCTRLKNNLTTEILALLANQKEYVQPEASGRRESRERGAERASSRLVGAPKVEDEMWSVAGGFEVFVKTRRKRIACSGSPASRSVREVSQLAGPFAG